MVRTELREADVESMQHMRRSCLLSGAWGGDSAGMQAESGVMKSSAFWKHLCDCWVKNTVTVESREHRKDSAREEQNEEGDGMKRQSWLLSK